MNLLGAIVGSIVRVAGTVVPTLMVMNQTRSMDIQSRAIELSQKRDSDNRDLGIKRMEFDAKMEMLRQAARAKERQEDREYSLSLEQVKADSLLKTEQMRQAFQALETQKQRDFTQAIEKFKAELQIALQNDSLAFQRWRTETDREFTLALRDLDALILRQRDKQNRDDAKRDRNSPVFTVADDTLNVVLNREKMPLTIFFSPPVLRYDPAPSASTQSQFPMMESTLAAALRHLFEQYNNCQRPIKFMHGDWITKNRRGESALNQIYGDLKEIPVVVLETEIEESYLHINIGFWNNDFDDARFKTVVRKFHWQDAITEISQRLKNQWQTQGRTTETEIDRAEFIRRSREAFTHYMEVLHCIHVGMVADEYFLLYSPQRQLPLLPTLLPELLEEVNLPAEECTALIHGVIDYENALFDGIAQAEPATIISLRLEWAAVLQQLDDRYTFESQVKAAMQSWLQERNVQESNDPVTDISTLLIPEDKSFVDQINPCLAALELPLFNIALSCFQRGSRYLEAGDSKQAKLDFDRTISLNPHAEVYYKRALALYALEEYQSSINDFDQAAMLQPNRAEIYEYRGDAYRKLKNYEIALANYNQAIHLGSSRSVIKRDTLQNWLTDVHRQNQERKAKADDFYNGGIFHWENRNYAEAISDFEMAEEHGHPDARQRLLEILVSQTSKVNYLDLYNQLKQQNWKEADQTTKQLMWKVENTSSYLRNLPSFPVEDLAIIDGLWRKYSSGHFGFACQITIWNEENKNPAKFATRIGWGGSSLKSYGELKFDLSAPQGHLPSGDELGGSGGYGWESASKFQIIVDKLTQKKIDGSPQYCVDFDPIATTALGFSDRSWAISHEVEESR